jgi:hypothetical protein
MPNLTCYASHPHCDTADLLKRHAERHDKRELNGYEVVVKPGRIKGVPGKKQKKTSFANPPTTGTLEPLLAGPLDLISGTWPLSAASSVNSAYHTPVQSVSGSEYDHGRAFCSPLASSV